MGIIRGIACVELTGHPWDLSFLSSPFVLEQQIEAIDDIFVICV